jgi:hypothetical protein
MGGNNDKILDKSLRGL